MPKWITIVVIAPILSVAIHSQTNPLWHSEKVKNYLPHMTWPEVESLLTRTDMVIVPIPAIEQHGPQLPIGTDYFTGEELAKLIAQRTDVLVAPVLLPGISPYHMEFPGTITLSPDTVQRVYFEAVQSLIHHGFRRFLIFPSHAGNMGVSRYIVDRINQETPGIAVELNEAAAPFFKGQEEREQKKETPRGEKNQKEDKTQFDRHAGVDETSTGLYLFSNLVEMGKAGKNELTLPDHLHKSLPQVTAGESTVTRVFLAEALKPKSTGKHTSTREMTTTGVWSERDTREASADEGRQESDAFVSASVRFIERWKELKPLQPLAERRSY
jgi:creatinine amidohydrolase